MAERVPDAVTGSPDDPWMTVASDTYIAQTLALFNWQTQPLDIGNPQGDKGLRVRYPEVDLADFAGVDRVLLSSEPFHFKEHHVREVEGLVPGASVSLIDGEIDFAVALCFVRKDSRYECRPTPLTLFEDLK